MDGATMQFKIEDYRPACFAPRAPTFDELKDYFVYRQQKDGSLIGFFPFRMKSKEECVLAAAILESENPERLLSFLDECRNDITAVDCPTGCRRGIHEKNSNL